MSAAPHLLELIGLAIRHLNEVPELDHRAALLEAAATVCEREGRSDRALGLRHTAAEFRRADDAQLRLEEIFTRTDRT